MGFLSRLFKGREYDTKFESLEQKINDLERILHGFGQEMKGRFDNIDDRLESIIKTKPRRVVSGKIVDIFEYCQWQDRITTKEVAEHFKISKPMASEYLHRLIERGKLRSVARGTFRIVGKPEKEEKKDEVITIPF